MILIIKKIIYYKGSVENSIYVYNKLLSSRTQTGYNILKIELWIDINSKQMNLKERKITFGYDIG